MQQYILRRLVQMIFVLLLFSMVVFAVLRLVPGDPVAAQLGLEASQEAYDQFRGRPTSDFVNKIFTEPSPERFALTATGIARPCNNTSCAGWCR